MSIETSFRMRNGATFDGGTARAGLPGGALRRLPCLFVPLLAVVLVGARPVHGADLCAGVVCVSSGDCSLPGTCDPATGTCIPGAPKPAGIRCSERKTCTVNARCDGAGQCVGDPKPAGARCSDRNGCTGNDRCDEAGQCVGEAKAAGSRCNDGNACTAHDRCDGAGACVGGEPRSEGHRCSTDDRCGDQKTCQAGVCTPATVVTCAPLDGCHVAACDPTTGGCLNRATTDGTPCGDGTPSTARDFCVAGACETLPPPLSSLTVSPLALRPAFSPSIHDYAVLCDAGTNSLALGLTAAPGASVSLAAPLATMAGGSTTVMVSLQEDQAAVVEATDASGAVERYWVRCLPHDFPVLAATPHPEAGTPTPGWYLMGNAFVAIGSGSFAMVVDAQGTPVWYHRSPGGAVAVEPFPDSTIAVSPLLGPGFGADPNRGITLYHLDPWTTEPVLAVGIPTDLHEIRSLPNGNRMVLSYPLKAGVDLTGLPGLGPNETIADCAVQELTPAGDLVWEWRMTDHTDPVKESVAPAPTPLGALTVIDVYHCNSIDVNEAGDVLVSARETDAAFLISRATGKIVWKLGGTPFNADGAQLITIADDPETAFFRQHDARFQPNGNISLFDDHGAGSGPARGVEYELDLDAGTARVAWQYQGDASSFAMGSFRRYADGGSVIGWGASNGAESLAFTEVDASGRNLLDLSFVTYGNWAYRAVKVPLETFDRDVLRNTAGLP